MINPPEHIVVPSQERDVGWLKQSLQAAVELELSTPPIYLSMTC